MALRFIDGFNHYNSFLEKYEQTDNNAPAFTGSGRFGSGMSLVANTGGRGVKKILDAQQTWIVGFAYQASVQNTDHVICRLIDGSTTHGELHVSAAGRLYHSLTGTSEIASCIATQSLSAAVWYYIEWYVTIDDSAGVSKCRVNGVSQWNQSSKDTRNGGNASANIIDICCNVTAGSTPTTTVDDLYICDGTGGSGITDTFLGDIRVEDIYPNGDGNYSQLVGSDGNSTNNSLLVDETDADTADYVESGTVNDKDTYAYGNLTTTTGTVFGVQPLMWAEKTGAGSRSIASLARLSATDVASADYALSNSYTYARDVREAKPGGGVWTITDVNSAEFGVKVTV